MTTTQEETEQTFPSEFASGFSGEEIPTESGEQKTGDVVETQAEDAGAEKSVTDPETVSITAQDWKRVQDGIAELENVKRGTRAEFDKLGGKYGEINRALQQRRIGVEVSKEALDELKSEFPELGTKLEKLFSKDGAKPAQGITPEELEQRLQERIREHLRPELERSRQLENQLVDTQMMVFHRDWKNVVKSPEFEDWRKSLPEAEANQTLYSDDVDFASGQISKFKAYRQALAEKAQADATRKAKQQNGNKRLEAAIAPKGTSVGTSALTEHDLFLQGFKEP